jgi:hypothetical protein
MTLHPLITQELSRARQDHRRREAEAARSFRAPAGDNDHPADVRWIRRYLRVEETRCCTPGETSW